MRDLDETGHIGPRGTCKNLHLPLPRGRWVQNLIMGVVVDGVRLTSAVVRVEDELEEEKIMALEVEEEVTHGTLPRLGGSHAPES